MSKIVSMSSGAIDPIAQSKRVFFRPSDAGVAIVLSVGDAVCYKRDAVDHKERTVDPTHLGLTIDTYAEGEQEMTGRLFSVEEPLIGNIDQFAGIVKVLGPKAGKDGDMIEIWTANSGAVVPANLAGSITTVVGRTILSVVVGQRTLGCPITDMPNYGWTAGTTDSKVVGIAMEVRTTTGKCWVKLDENMFMHQGGQVDQEFEVAAVADDVTVNRSNIKFLNTQDDVKSLHMRAYLSSTCKATTGVYRFDVKVLGEASGTVYGHQVYMEVAGDQTSGGIISATRVLMRSRNSDANISALAYICSTQYEWSLTAAGAGGAVLTNPCTLRPWFRFLADGSLPTHWFYANGIATFGGKQTVANAPALSTEDMCIPVRIGGNTYNIIAFADQCDA